MTALTTLPPDVRSLPRADKLRLIELLAQDLADAEGPVPRPIVRDAGRLPGVAAPRLADSTRAGDFIKHVCELAPDDTVRLHPARPAASP